MIHHAISVAGVSAWFVLCASCARNADPHGTKPVSIISTLSSTGSSDAFCNATELATLLKGEHFIAAAQMLRDDTSECARDALADKQQQVTLGAGLLKIGGCHRLREVGEKAGVGSFTALANQCLLEHSASCNGANRLAVDEALRQARATEGKKQWGVALERIEAAEKLCADDPEVLLEKAIVADERAVPSTKLWQIATMAMERQTGASPTLLLDESSLHASVRFAFDERETLAYPEELGCAATVDRFTARPLKAIRWLTTNPSIIDRTRNVVITVKNASYSITDTQGVVRTSYSFERSDTIHRKDNWTLLTPAERSRLVWLDEFRGMFVDPLNGDSYRPSMQKGLDLLFHGSPVETISVSPSGNIWVIYKKPAVGELAKEDNAYKDIVQAWDAPTAKKLREYPGRAGYGLALSESEVVLHDFERQNAVLWNIETGKSELVSPDPAYTFEVDAVLSDKKTLLLNKFIKGRLPGGKSTATLWTLGSGLRRYETESNGIRDVSTDGKWAIGGQNLLTHPHAADNATAPTSDFYDVVSVDTGEALSSVEVARATIRELAPSPKSDALAIQTETGTSILSFETGLHKKLPYPYGWNMEWLSASSIAFGNHDRWAIEIVDLANGFAVRRIDEVTPMGLGQRWQFNAFGNSNRIFSVTETALVATSLVNGQVELKPCGNRCRILAAPSTRQDLLLTWEETDRKGFGVAMLDANSLKIRASASVPFSAPTYKLTNSMLPASDARGVSPNGRWVPLVVGEWIGIWDLKASGEGAVKILRVAGPLPVTPVGATDADIYFSLGEGRFVKVDWETGRQRGLEGTEFERFGKQIMLRGVARKRHLHIAYRNGTVLGDIYFDRDGVLNIAKDPTGRIDFFGSPPRHMPTCLYGNLFAPFAACADAMHRAGFARKLLDVVRNAERGEAWAS